MTLESSFYFLFDRCLPISNSLSILLTLRISSKLERHNFLKHFRKQFHGLVRRSLSQKRNWRLEEGFLIYFYTHSPSANAKLINNTWGHSRPLLLRISSAHTLYWALSCHVIFKHAHQVENSTKYRGDYLCFNLVCKYFCWMLGGPHFFWRMTFLFLSIILKNKKKSVHGKL